MASSLSIRPWNPEYEKQGPDVILPMNHGTLPECHCELSYAHRGGTSDHSPQVDYMRLEEPPEGFTIVKENLARATVGFPCSMVKEAHYAYEAYLTKGIFGMQSTAPDYSWFCPGSWKGRMRIHETLLLSYWLKEVADSRPRKLALIPACFAESWRPACRGRAPSRAKRRSWPVNENAYTINRQPEDVGIAPRTTHMYLSRG